MDLEGNACRRPLSQEVWQNPTKIWLTGDTIWKYNGLMELSMGKPMKTLYINKKYQKLPICRG